MNRISDKTVKQMSRLKPINKCPKNQIIFNNMAFVIFCPKHRKIAVSDNFDERRELAVWLPFVYLSSDTTIRITVVESVSLILSGENPEQMTLYTKEEPFDSKISEIRNTMIKEKDFGFDFGFHFGFTRCICLVRLHSDNPVLQCCRKTSRIIWLDIEHISNDYIDCLWGPQIKSYFEEFHEIFESVHTFHYFSTFINLLPRMESDQDVLESLNITGKQIQIFYKDFIEHCFPSVYMTFVSFKDYLGKYGFRTSEKSMKRLFNGFMKDTQLYEYRGDDLSFEELLIGIAHIDSQSIYNDNLIGFVFRYFDVDRDGYLSKEELREMFEVFHKNETSDMIDILVADYWFIMSPSDRGVDYQQFAESVNNETVVPIVPVLVVGGHEIRILLKIISTLETRNERIVSPIKTFWSHFCRKIFKK